MSDTNMEKPPARSKMKSPGGLGSHLGSMTAKSRLDEFRRFFDLKQEAWRDFRGKLHSIIYELYSWEQVQQLDTRYACAAEFLKRFGNQYWGTPENREKYLMDEHLGSDDFCIYPDHRAESASETPRW